MANVRNLSDAQLRNRVQKLSADVKLDLHPKALPATKRELEAVEAELRRRTQGSHPLRKLGARIAGRLSKSS